MKKISILILTLLLLPSIFAITVEKQSSNEVMIPELNKPAIFDIIITNNETTDTFKFYNLLGFEMEPVGDFKISKGDSKEIQLKIYPREDFDYRGHYTFQYFIKGTNSKTEQGVTAEIINLEDAFEIGSGELDPESNTIQIYIQNKKNFNFGEIQTKFKSVFFEIEKEFPLEPNEKKTFETTLNKEDFKKLMAGFYTLNAEITVDDVKTEIEGLIKFEEKDILKTSSKNYGFIVSTQIIEKTNEGNVLAESETVLKKNIVSRLFTTFNPEPTQVERKGTTIYYTWHNEIKPGESLEIKVKTNWLYPLIVIILIIIIILLVKQYTKRDLTLRKKVKFINAKGGEFALKVTIIANAKKYVEKVSIIDRLPPLVKIYERFGPEKPTRIDEKNKRIEWNFEKLEAGEMRTLTYIIYSKVGVVGRFALPSATAIYEHDGEIKESESNRAFFMSEPRGKDKDDY